MDAQEPSAASAVPRALLLAFTAAIVLSAALLFVVQPMFTKMVLPQLGGSPAVWSVAIVFFQAVLLAGYVYADLLTRHLSTRASVITHVALMAAATLTLPLAIAAGWGRPPSENQALWLLGLFAVSIGLPFFALSANAPLIQAWFARSAHPRAKEPYFLYAASNIGSMVALLSYPFVIEPLSRLPQQRIAWSAGYSALILLVGGCGFLAWRAGGSERGAAVAQEAGARPSWRQATIWLGLAAVPSGLLIAVTAHLSTDIAPSPFLWVIPLALYLLSFVIVFQDHPILPHRSMLLIQPVLLVALVATIVYTFTEYLPLVMLLHVAAFFVTAMVCHGELARRRPRAGHLTAFYMWMSAGGVLGGIAAALIAPAAFSWVAEYPILIVLAILCRPVLSLSERKELALVATGLALLAILIAVPATLFELTLTDQQFYWSLAILLVLALAASRWRNPALFAGFIMLTFMVWRFYEVDLDHVRSFFGVHKLVDRADGIRVLQHGTTIHGAERLVDIEAGPQVRPQPLTYFHERAATVQTINAARARTGGPVSVAIIGLGAGTLACHAQAGDSWSYYEIDPAVVAIAGDAQRFTYLAACQPDIPIVMGDARLTLGDAADASYDVIVVDAFASDTMPVHLMTKEAMALYAGKLKPGGIVALHVSSRYMELVSVVAGIAHANGLVARLNPPEDVDEPGYEYASTVVACARKDEDFTTLVSEGNWTTVTPDPRQWVWTDDYSNVIGAIIRHIGQ
ncbi:MAG: fused MFS/spermidine synthase [Xanthobacteraceae bacterium]